MAATATRVDSDPSNWIHRDKLTAIEVQEYIDLGKEVPPELLRRVQEREKNGGSRSRSRKGGSGSGSQERATSRGDRKKQRVASPDPPRDEPEHDPYEGLDEYSIPVFNNAPKFGDPRPTDEIEEERNQVYSQSGGSLHKSSSRIPLSKSSPNPIPSQHLARNAPLPRKQSASNAWGDENDPKSRSRSQSSGSAVEPEPSSPITSTTPSKTPAGKKRGGSTSARQPSNPRMRSASNAKASPGVRPTTRDGPRPPTRERAPEGDPPWMDSMFKPDPRLPPDQQMLPTHAKRMMQEQWAKEEQPGDAFDKNYRPLSVFKDEKARASEDKPSKRTSQMLGDTKANGMPVSEKKKSQVLEGPTPPPKSPVAAAASSHQRQGGPTYSATPRMQNQPVYEGGRKPAEGMRIEQDEAKKGGCGCCIVM